MSAVTSVNIKSVLLIDDDPSCNFILSEFINLVDKSVAKHETSSVDDALAYLLSTSQYPDVIFLDLNMPIKSGFDFLDEYQERFFQNNPNTKIIVLTSSLRPSDREQTLSFDCVTDYKSKSEIDQFIFNSLKS